MTRPLEALRVLDFTRVLAGPHAARMLCDLGAEVIKIEPPEGDLTRFGQPRLNSLATYFIQQNVGKSNISLDFTHPRAVDIARRLADISDVVIENFRPGVMERLGLGYDELSARNPRLVYASISGYGATGPWVDRRAYAPVVNAETGLTKHQGDVRDGDYANDPFSHGDVYTGMEAAAGILAALLQRERTGRGQFLDISMAETLLYVNEHAHDQLWEGEVPADWIRSFQPADYPVLTTRDGSIVVVSGHPASKTNFGWFCAAMGRSDLEADPRFVDVASRLRHLDELDEILRKWATTVANADEIERIFAEHHLATGRLRSVADVARTDWARQRGVIAEVSDRAGGVVRIPQSPWKFSDADVRIRGVPKYRGEDNAEILRSLLNVDDDTIAQLESDGVISSHRPG
ncbi:MAG: CaiB/BaiF CoA transferase family protein [Ilumatobacteraceae bacterium]|jgi:crotonobetainyl-CoA:carnitine CoA-transferase CaiB-like acyl-CoA transferase